MALTANEEEIAKLMIAEREAREELNIAITARDTEYRTGINAVKATVFPKHDANIATLQAVYDAAEQAVEDNFK